MKQSVAFCIALFLMAASQALGQSCPPPRPGSPGDTTKADIVVAARIHAESLRFDVSPDVRASLSGCPQLDTARVSMRTNLPRPVQPGVTYRNVTVDVRLRARFSEIDCLIADILPGIGADSAQIRGATSACMRRDTIR